jgi:hypothetical protein
VSHRRALVRAYLGEPWTIELVDRSATTGHVWTVEQLAGVRIIGDEQRPGRLGQRRLVTLVATRDEGVVRLCEQATRPTMAPASRWTVRVSAAPASSRAPAVQRG